jgi:hypothetical protein
MYATGTGVKAYSKRPIILKTFNIIDRVDVQPNTIEHLSQWKEMKSTPAQAQSARRVKELEKLIWAEQGVAANAQAPG